MKNPLSHPTLALSNRLVPRPHVLLASRDASVLAVAQVTPQPPPPHRSSLAVLAPLDYFGGSALGHDLIIVGAHVVVALAAARVVALTNNGKANNSAMLRGVPPPTATRDASVLAVAQVTR